jgi:hypothetical protein
MNLILPWTVCQIWYLFSRVCCYYPVLGPSNCFWPPHVEFGLLWPVWSHKKGSNCFGLLCVKQFCGYHSPHRRSNSWSIEPLGSNIIFVYAELVSLILDRASLNRSSCLFLTFAMILYLGSSGSKPMSFRSKLHDHFSHFSNTVPVLVKHFCWFVSDSMDALNLSPGSNFGFFLAVPLTKE